MTDISEQHGEFVSTELPYNYKIYLKYGNFPDHADGKRLKTGDYAEITKEFYEWARRNLNSNYLPSEEILQNKLYLIKAEHFDDKTEDIAYFGDIMAELKANRIKVRITQTGGVNSSIYFFINYPDIKIKLDKEKVQQLIMESIYALLNNPAEIAALIEDISENGDLFEIRKKPVDNFEYQIQTFQGFMLKNTICFSFKKNIYPKDKIDVPAKEPMPNEWFEYRRKQGQGFT